MKKIIISNPYGQLCNRLTRLAHLLAFSIEHKFVLIDIYFDEYAHYFSHFKNQKVPHFSFNDEIAESELSEIKKSARNYLRFQSRISMTSKVLNLNYINKFHNSIYYSQSPNSVDLTSAEYMKKIFFSNKDKIFLYGWLFLAPKLIIKHRDEILNILKPLQKFIDSAKQLEDKARKNCDKLIGVHIRHGDFKDTKAFHSIQRYKIFMNKAKELFPDKKVGFIICSNEKIKDDDFKGINAFFSDGGMIEDWYTLSLCDYIIGTESSFGQWSAFYGNVPYFTLRDFTKYIELEDFKIHSSIFPDWFLDVTANAIANSGKSYEIL